MLTAEVIELQEQSSFCDHHNDVIVRARAVKHTQLCSVFARLHIRPKSPKCRNTIAGHFGRNVSVFGGCCATLVRIVVKFSFVESHNNLASNYSRRLRAFAGGLPSDLSLAYPSLQLNTNLVFASGAREKARDWPGMHLMGY